MGDAFNRWVADELAALRAAGLEKPERVITSAQGAEIRVSGRDGPVINLCSNNYLGLAGDPRIADAAIEATRRWGAGLASVRFICGTQEIHKALEAAIAAYVGLDDAILFAAAFDANGGVFEPLLGEGDAIVSDALNHASIIDGVRLSKAKRYRFANGDLDELEARLKEARAAGARTILIATDGVFSMDGHIADLAGVRALADRHDALILVDDCHATGFVGPQGRGTPALGGVSVDIVTGTFGKALGGAMGGFIAASADVVALLRQRARPYLFSNALAPAVCGASLKAIDIAQGAEGDDLRGRLEGNARRLRAGLTAAGFTLVPGRHPITPVMLGEAALAQRMAARLLEEGVFVTGFSFPVVPHGQARIRAQVSAAHTPDHVDRAVAAFTRVGRELGVVE